MIATSIEQSYKLLEAGLSPDSADMHWSSRKMEKINGEWRIVKGELVVGKCDAPNDLPAWSYSRLYEIRYNSISIHLFRILVADVIFMAEKGYIAEKYLKK